MYLRVLPPYSSNIESVTISVLKTARYHDHNKFIYFEAAVSSELYLRVLPPYSSNIGSVTIRVLKTLRYYDHSKFVIYFEGAVRSELSIYAFFLRILVT